jgi:hypothetical protein
MSDTKISALPSAGGLTGSEPVAIVQSSTTKQTTTQDIADLAVTGNTNIELITNAAILVKEAGSLLDLNTLYQITDATPYVMQVQADAVNAIGKSAIIIDATYGGSGYYDATTDAFKGNIYDVDSNVFNLTLPSDITLGSSTALNNFIGCGANVLGDSCRRNTFMQGTNGWTFGNSLSEVTIYAASGTSGLDCTNLTNFGFLYSNAYPAEIKYDSTNWYHYYNDPANDRIVQTLMAAPYTVTYIGGGTGDVTKVGTPVDNQVGVWTGDGTIEGDANLTFDTSTDTLTTVNEVLSGSLNEAKGSDIASATTTDIGAATGNYVVITGTTTITGLGTVQAGTRRTVNFSGILILTHNGTSLILPTGANITTAVGDTATFVSLGSGNWVCTNYQRASGAALVGGGSDTYVIQFTAPQLTTIADSTSYHISVVPALTFAGSDAIRACKFPTAGTVTEVSMMLNQVGNGSGETVSLYIRNVTTATDSLVGTFTSDFGASTTLKTLFSGLSIAVNTTDDWTFKIATPAWATNPTFWSMAQLVKIAV